jgi:CoA:oxalate CoA-transferase
MATQSDASAGHLDPTRPHTLEGITVVDFTRVLAGPTCTRMLADAGARVIKIERPRTGDDTRLMGPFAADGTSEAAMEEVLQTATASTWSERLENAGVPVSEVLNVDDTRKLEQIKVRGMVKKVDGYDVPGTPLKFGALNSVGTMIPSPPLDNCGAALRAEFGAKT